MRRFGQKNEGAAPSFGMGMNPAMNANKMYGQSMQFGPHELKQFFQRSNDLYGKVPPYPRDDPRLGAG